MASPVGHALAGLALGRLTEGGAPPGGRLFVPLCAALAVAPDLDFLPGLLVGQPALYHQGGSHSLAAALLVSLGLSLALGRDSRSRRLGFAAFFAAYSSHLLLDYLGTDARPPLGVPLLWPVSDATWISPISFLPGVHHATSGVETSGEWLKMVFSRHNLRPILFELMLVGPLLLLALGSRRWRRKPVVGNPQGGRADSP